MNRDEIAEKLARRAKVSRAEAADEVDRIVNGILRNLRKGEPTTIPGLGTLIPGPKPEFRPEKKRRDR